MWHLLQKLQIYRWSLLLLDTISLEVSIDRTGGAKEETVDTQCNGENWINYITGLFWFCLSLVLWFLLLVFCVVAVVWQNLPTSWQNKSLITKIQSSSPRFRQLIRHYSFLFCAPNESQTESKTSCNYDSLTFCSPIENGTSSSGNPQARTKRLEPNVLALDSSLLSRRFSRTPKLAPPSFPHFWL